jgi:hypothetical protein
MGGDCGTGRSFSVFAAGRTLFEACLFLSPMVLGTTAIGALYSRGGGVAPTYVGQVGIATIGTSPAARLFG